MTGNLRQVVVSWTEAIERAEAIRRRFPPGTRFYGIPRGGSVVAALLGSPVGCPEDADVIVDDVYDSGRTAERFVCHGKPMAFLVDKRHELRDAWIVFPWDTSVEQDTEGHVARVLQSLGEDITREGLQETPRRHVKFLREFLSPEPFAMTTFENEGAGEMILQTGISFFSLCEHHIVPFWGTASVAYIPGERIVGLSKLARVVDHCARRLQNQERITTEIADYLETRLAPRGVAVKLRARHLCMEMRGVRKHDVHTETSCFRGEFVNDRDLIERFEVRAR